MIWLMKTIIIYTTKYGGVKKAAEMLSSKLSGEVLQKNLTKEKAPALKEFDNVILGGSIYIGKIQKALTKYITANLAVLLQKKVGLFILAGEPDPLRTRELENSFPDNMNYDSENVLKGYKLAQPQAWTQEVPIHRSWLASASKLEISLGLILH